MKCVPCEGVGQRLGPAQVKVLSRKLPGWKVSRHKIISREFMFKDFVGSIRFVNRVAKIAEKEGHHPNLHIHWNRVRVDLWTHAVGGLSRNDFIVAAKINRLK